VDFELLFGLHPFTRAQAIGAGVTPWQWHLVKPTLVRLERGVYLLRWASDARTRHCQRVAGALLSKTDHFAIGMSAVALLGLPDPPHHKWDLQPVQIAAKRARGKRGIAASTATPIPTPWGLCTDLVDTAIHIAATTELPEALMVTDAVARQIAGTQNRDILASQACRTEVRRRLTETADHPALRLANPAAEAASESFYRGHMLLSGYDDPPCGVPTAGWSGKPYFIDILVDGLAIEVDGDGKYKDPQDLLDEKEREDDLRLTGLDFLRPRVKALYADPQARMNELAAKVDHVQWPRRRSG
jgi:hypothetical protein